MPRLAFPGPVRVDARAFRESGGTKSAGLLQPDWMTNLLELGGGANKIPTRSHHRLVPVTLSPLVTVHHSD